MKVIKILFAVLGLSLVVPAAVFFIPTGDAVDVGCIEDDDAHTLIVLPPQGQLTNFTPECLVIENGSTVEWRNLDSQVHDPTVWGCFEADLLGSGETASVELVWHEHNETVTAVSSDGSMTECSTYGPLGRQLVHVHDDRVEIQYFCQVHPLPMIAKIVIPR